MVEYIADQTSMWLHMVVGHVAGTHGLALIINI